MDNANVANAYVMDGNEEKLGHQCVLRCGPCFQKKVRLFPELRDRGDSTGSASFPVRYRVGKKTPTSLAPTRFTPVLAQEIDDRGK